MSSEINYQNNPLTGLSLKNMVTELVSHYGFEILHAYLNINCFKTNPSIESSIKFLKKTQWAREKVEMFYMYQYKSLRKVSSEQFNIPPRDRIVADDDKPGEPAKLSLEDAEQLREKQAKRAAEYGKKPRQKSRSEKAFRSRDTDQHSRRGDHDRGNSDRASSSRHASDVESKSVDPWANWKKNNH